ncbi:MAG: NfeD family protein [Acidimicrobiales bacterium]
MIAGFALLVMGVALSPGTAAARQSDPGDAPDEAPVAEPDDPGVVRVVKVSGLLDPIMVSFLEDEIEAAQDAGITALVLQVNSEGAVVSDQRMDDLVASIEESSVLVGVWVGPSGSKALDEATRLVAAAEVSGLPQGSRVEVTSELVGEADLDGRTSIGETVGSELANELGIVDSPAPIIGEFILDLPDVQSEVGEAGREPVTPVRFGQLGLIDQLFHTVASPAVAYLLLVIGASLLVFELFTAGVGVAGMVGAGSLVLAAYGLAVLPTNTWAIAVLGLSFVAFAVDVQTGVPRLWTAIGTLGLVVGSLFVFADGPPSWITLIAGIGGTLLAMLGGMPAMVRTRFSTPTIGRDWMIGETGTAVASVDPDGIITLRDAPWRAHTNRATPIAQGDHVRVVAIDGLVLEVEPLEGAAKDYRSH